MLRPLQGKCRAQLALTIYLGRNKRLLMPFGGREASFANRQPAAGTNFPEEGGAFTWSRKYGYNTLGFVAGCAYLGKGIVSTVVISLAFAIYTTQVIEGLPPYAMHVVAGAAVLLVAAVNYLGVEL